MNVTREKGLIMSSALKPVADIKKKSFRESIILKGETFDTNILIKTV